MVQSGILRAFGPELRRFLSKALQTLRGPQSNEVFVVFHILWFGVCILCKRHCRNIMGPDQIYSDMGPVFPSAHSPAQALQGCPRPSPTTSPETGWPITEVHEPSMSALGQKQTCAVQKVMSALLPKADMCGATRDVRFGSLADKPSRAKIRLCPLLSKRTSEGPPLGSGAVLRGNARRTCRASSLPAHTLAISTTRA